MPNKHAAIKDLRKNRKHAAKNSRLKMHVKALSSQLHTLLSEGKKKEAETLARSLQQAIDKATKNHIFPANKAGRKKSQMNRKLAVQK